MKIYQVDAFTTQPFKGNPAGVCLAGKSHAGGLDALAGDGDEPFRDCLHPGRE